MYENILSTIKKMDTVENIGKIENIVGMSMEASGTGKSSIGDICMIYSDETETQVAAEVVGFKGDHVQLMTYKSSVGITSGAFVRNTRRRLRIPVGDFLKGRIVDAQGMPIDGGAPFPESEYYTVNNSYMNPLDRPPIRERLQFGIKAIDGLNTIGKGQRIGIFSGSGVGKSTLMGMIARNVKADINVIALVGERGREILEFVEKDLGEEGMKRTILVVATSDQPAMLRVKAPLVATTIAEYFRDKGMDVLLMMDSLTRFAMAQREIGLATGEPPIARGYTPSIYAEFPRLLERAGAFRKGSITGVYTVLVEGDDTNEPIADTVRGILDGHIVLSRQLAAENHYPAIDIGMSISRLMTELVSEEHKKYAARIRNVLGLYQKNADLIAIGAYKKGSDPKLDDVIDRYPAINEFLTQNIDESFSYEETVIKGRAEMKKFCYSLESVYRFKQNVLDKKKEELAKKEQDVQKQKNLLEELNDELHYYEAEFERIKKEGCSIENMMIYVRGLERMEKRIKKEENELTRLMVIAEEKKKEVIKAHMDTNTFEKLKEKRLEEYRVQGRKAEESFIEEFVTHAMKA